MAGKLLVATAQLMLPRCTADGTLRGFQSANGADVDAPHRVSPAEQCTFPAAPEEPYYWDPNCTSADVSLACWADGVHAQCRFCGESPYLGIPCPSNAVVPSVAACRFPNEPTTSAYWEPTCYVGMKGCFADGENVGCRFCGDGNYSDIPSPPAVCEFVNEPWTPYYWEPSCHRNGQSLGCHADGVHPECRFCDKVPFQSVPCPDSARPAYGFKECWFPHGSATAHYWDEDCEWGILGCWADGVNAQCRYCGSGVYIDVACPSTTTDVVTQTIAPQELTSATANSSTETTVVGAVPWTTTDSSTETSVLPQLTSTTVDTITQTFAPQEPPSTTVDLIAETTAPEELP